MKKNKKQFYDLFNDPFLSFTSVDSIKEEFSDVDKAWEFYKNDYYYEAYKNGEFLYSEKNSTKWISDFRYCVGVDILLLTGKKDGIITVKLTNKERKQ